MNLICLIRHHIWRFSYNHGIPLGDPRSIDEVLEDLKTGKAYQVDECTRCHAQSRVIDGVRVILKPHEMERP